MMLYWGIFTLGFYFGAILTFIIFAPKKPEEELEGTYNESRSMNYEVSEKRLSSNGQVSSPSLTVTYHN